MYLRSLSSRMWCRFVGVLHTDFGRDFKRSQGNGSAIALGNWVIVDATEGMRWQERSFSSTCDGSYLIILLFWETSYRLALYVSPLLSLYSSLSPPHFSFAPSSMKFMVSSSYYCMYIHIMCMCLCKHIYIYIYNIVNTFSFAYMWVCECLFRADHLILDKLWGHLSLKETDSSLNRHLPPTSLCVGVETCGIFLFSIGMPFDAVIILICFSQPHCLEFLYTIYFELY